MPFIDIFYLSRLVRPGGLLVVDDIWMPAVRWAMDHAITNYGWSVDGRYPEEPEFENRQWHKRPELAGVNHVVFRMSNGDDVRKWDHFVPFGDDHGALSFT